MLLSCSIFLLMFFPGFLFLNCLNFIVRLFANPSFFLNHDKNIPYSLTFQTISRTNIYVNETIKTVSYFFHLTLGKSALVLWKKTSRSSSCVKGLTPPFILRSKFKVFSILLFMFEDWNPLVTIAWGENSTLRSSTEMM